MLLRAAVLHTSFLLVFLLCPSRCGYSQGGPSRPFNLRTEYLVDPLGIDVVRPRFSWLLQHSQRAEVQSAYQIVVGTERRNLQGDQWDTGRISSPDFSQVVYNGKPLSSGRAYYWKVRYWDKEGRPSPYSAPARFETGFLSRDDWKAEWIGGANQLRTEFQLPENTVRARAYICGLGYYELRINGWKVGDNVLDPAWTTYEKRVLYTTYDVTPQLKRGANAVGVMLGEGWYKSRSLLFLMNIQLASGKRVTVASSTSWQGHNGAITSDSVWDGEVYDARLETPGWDQPGFDASSWSAAQKVREPGGVVSAQMMPAIQVVDDMTPVSLSIPQPGVYVYDLGQNMSGWVRLRVRGPRGSAVRMRFSELVYPNGTINRDNIREAKSRDIYILSGEGEETYEPRFTYHGFRYVEVRGFPGTPSLDSIRGRVVHTNVATVGSFAASKQILNQIQKLILWSQLTNLFSVPTDCDQRNERQGWMGDAQVTAEEAMMNFDMAAFYTNFIRDIHDVQGPDGTITDTVPHRYGSRPADPAWGTAYPQLCWYMWKQYGDRRVLEENYSGLKQYVEFLRSRAADNVLTFSYYGDWVAIDHTPGAYISDCYYYYDVWILQQIAQVLGKSDDTQTFGQLARQIKEALNRRFFNPETGSYSNGTQTANALAVFLKLEPDKDHSPVAGNLTNDIVYAHDTHVTTGFIGIKYLLPALTQIGRSDLAYELASQTTFPSWGYMVERGATTLWELWQEKTGPSMNSHDHAMFGSLGSWFYTALAGIDLGPDEIADAGYRHIRIEPHVVEDLRWASATIDTIRGRVSSSWTHSPGVITLEVETPAGADAKVVVPKETDMTDLTLREGDQVIWEKGHFVPGDAGISSGAVEHNAFVFEVGSGHYSFKLSGN